MTKKSNIILGIIAAVILGAALYFLYFMKTPAYAVERTIQAVRQHNTAEFSRYVDIPKVMGYAFDDSLKAESKINNDNILSNPFAVGILHMLKPSVVELMNKEALRLVANTKDETVDIVDPVPDAMMRNMERRLPIDELQLGDFSLEQTDDEHALATVALHNHKSVKNYILMLELTKQEDGYWKFTRIKNLTDLIVQFDVEKKAKLAAQNKPVMEKLQTSLPVIDKKISLTSALVEGVKEHRLNAVVTVQNKTNRTINRIYYDITIMDEKGNAIYSYPEHFLGSVAPNMESHLNTSKPLNVLLPDDKKLMAMDVYKLPCKVQITYLSFNDGTSLEPRTYLEY